MFKGLIPFIFFRLQAYIPLFSNTYFSFTLFSSFIQFSLSPTFFSFEKQNFDVSNVYMYVISTLLNRFFCDETSKKIFVLYRVSQFGLASQPVNENHWNKWKFLSKLYAKIWNRKATAMTINSQFKNPSSILNFEAVSEASGVAN